MAWIDAVLLGVLALSFVVGVLRGFVFELLSLLGWFAAYFCAQWLTPEVAPHLPIGKPGSGLHHAAAFAVTFIAALLVWAILSRLLRFVIQATPLSLPDRALGGLFGLLRGLVVLLTAATVIGLTPAAASPAWQASVIAPWLHVVLDVLRPVLPPSLSQLLPAHGPAR